jgi:hypothetical protein
MIQGNVADGNIDNYLLNDAIESDDEEESDDEDGGENQLTPQEQLVNYALTLDVEGTAACGFRPSHDGEGSVELMNKKQLDSHGRLLIVVYAVNSMGYNNAQNYIATKIAIALAAATIVSYDLGYKKVLGKIRVNEWIRMIEQSARIGSKKVLASKHKGRQTSYIDTVNAIDLTYLKQFYRYAMTLHGDAATYNDLANSMNAKANAENIIPDEMKPLHLSVGQLKRWFKEKKGKSLVDTTKPYLAEEQQQARVTYCRRLQEHRQWRARILYLDEKWFYTHSHRRWLKHLPREVFESVGCDKLKVRKVISRRYALKVMFIGAVGEPEPEHDFDGKIFLERIAEERALQ